MATKVMPTVITAIHSAGAPTPATSMTAPMSINVTAIQMRAVMEIPPFAPRYGLSETQGARSTPCHLGPFVTHLRGPRMAISKAHPPAPSELRLGAGLDLKHHSRQHLAHRPIGRWTARRGDDRPFRPGVWGGQLSVTAPGVASPRGGARQRFQEGW
jgi:hypothetical protein